MYSLLQLTLDWTPSCLFRWGNNRAERKTRQAKANGNWACELSAGTKLFLHIHFVILIYARCLYTGCPDNRRQIYDWQGRFYVKMTRWKYGINLSLIDFLIKKLRFIRNSFKHYFLVNRLSYDLFEISTIRYLIYYVYMIYLLQSRALVEMEIFIKRKLNILKCNPSYGLLYVHWTVSCCKNYPLINYTEAALTKLLKTILRKISRRISF